MGRSVSVPHNAYCTTYVHLDHDHEDPDESLFCWEAFIDNLQWTLQRKYKSLAKEDHWLDNEDHAILGNSQASVVVSEYCGLVSVSLVPKPIEYYDESLRPLRDFWCSQVSKGFLDLINSTFGGLRKIGTASNGEAFFQAI
jgi:hypothetical protein